MRLTPTTVLALAVALLVVLIGVEIATEVEPLVATFMLPAFVAALAASPRTVAALAALGIAAAITSGLVAPGALDLDAYLIRVIAVVLGAVFAVFAARQRIAAVEARDELDGALGNLADAVTVQEEAGHLVYANKAAAELLGVDTPEEVVATPATEFIARFDSFGEDGEPLDPDRYPGRKALLGEPAEPLLVRAVNKETGEERWQVIKATSIDAPGGKVRAINVIEDVTETKRAEISQRLLAEAGETLGSSLDYEATLQKVAHLAVPTFADWCGVSLPREDGRMEQVAVAHVDPDKVRFAHELNARYPSRIDDPGTAMILDAGRPILIEVSDELLRETAKDDEHYRLLREVGLRTAIGAPMFAGDEFLGTISFVTSAEGRRLTEDDLDVAGELARRASVAIQNARLFEERSHAARTLEQALRPPPLPEIPGWSAATMYEPASEGGLVGGDFYDAFEGRDGWMVVIGDVGGRGVDAAAITAMARYTLRTAGAMSDDPVIAFDRLNAWLLERADVEICTAAMVLLRPGGSVRVCSAGHPPPLVVSDGTAKPWGPRGPILGAFENTIWEVEERTLRDGEQLVLYTDGLFEVSGEDGRLGEKRLADVFDGVADPAGAVRKAHRALNDFAGGRFTDDMAMVVLERAG